MTDGNLSVERRGALAAIRFDNPPVNALNNGIRAELDRVLDALLGDSAVRGVMFTANGNNFVAGADIRELEEGVCAPFLGDMLRRIELSAKPFVAALKGFAMGGGLEIALACDRRIGAEDARLALPEIRLGLIPGGGGTQRLPRLIGAAPALDLLLSGRTVSAPEAFDIGLLDEIVNGEVEARGWEVLGAMSSKGASPARAYDEDAFVAAAQRVAADDALAALPAAGAMLAAVRAAFAADWDAGYAEERRLFLACRETPEAVRMLRAFLLERETRRQKRALA